MKVRRRYKWLIALLILVGVPYYWLLIDNRPGSAPPPRLEIGELRRLAASLPGPPPDSVALQQVGWRRVPGTLFVAGGGLKRNLISIHVFRLRGPWGDIVIDAGLGAADAEYMGLETFLAPHQARVDAALRAARLIVFTHEHIDHIAGLLRLPDFAPVARHALITPEQGPNGSLAGNLPWTAQTRAAVKPFRYARLAAIAPGVVLIRTPGHTPGSQMIYARLAEGREYLFAGDTATMARNWQELRARSRLVGDWIAPEDRAAVFGWLKAIRALKRSAPGLIVVPGHDSEHFTFGSSGHGIAFGFDDPPVARRAD